ncbi:hypothetical protein, partial [Listeria monocytogenes]|uniref:hypothetical protein n=1 Tax=Listeria monocytogenes TaxID=1639 RepID=UPI001C7DB9FA
YILACEDEILYRNYQKIQNIGYFVSKMLRVAVDYNIGTILKILNSLTMATTPLFQLFLF